jgi:hypothetical protein
MMHWAERNTLCIALRSDATPSGDGTSLCVAAVELSEDLRTHAKSFQTRKEITDRVAEIEQDRLDDSSGPWVKNPTALVGLGLLRWEKRGGSGRGGGHRDRVRWSHSYG